MENIQHFLFQGNYVLPNLILIHNFGNNEITPVRQLIFLANLIGKRKKMTRLDGN